MYAGLSTAIPSSPISPSVDVSSGVLSKRRLQWILLGRHQPFGEKVLVIEHSYRLIGIDLRSRRTPGYHTSILLGREK